MMKPIFEAMANGTPINAAQFTTVFDAMMSGELPDAQIAAFLLGLERQGVGAEELHIGARALRAAMSPVNAPAGAIDIVGTGGDGLSTYNISTAAAFVCAGAGLCVAKHGNRAVSSKSGASDVLSALGVRLDIDTPKTEACLRAAGAAFLFAPNHHKAMAHVGPARAALGIRTIFNRLGPLCNPANVDTLLLGVYDDSLRHIYAEALRGLGAKRALIVHGSDGMDEITTTGTTNITELSDGKISERTIAPSDFGLNAVKLSDLEGGDPAHNAAALSDIFEGKQNAYSDIVALNAGAALYIGGKADSIENGLALAQATLQNGGAKDALARLVQVSNG